MLIDFGIPGMSGAEVARRVQTTRPVADFVRHGLCGPGRAPGVSEAQIIGKPFVDTELHEKVRTALPRRAPGKVVGLRRC